MALVELVVADSEARTLSILIAAMLARECFELQLIGGRSFLSVEFVRQIA